ncbi:MAG: hypothetical protein U5L45_00160 [Saprospiraceae bacterium]|nr:hypothetical protein [Saprospiraceae bacterium]
MKKILVILFFFTIIIACSLPKLGLSKQDVQGNPFNMQGVYYGKKKFLNYIFYKNGVVLGGASFSRESSNIDSLVAYWTDKKQYTYNYNIPYAWGLFKINNDKMNGAQWRGQGINSYGVTKFSAKILNDTTMLLLHPSYGIDTFYFHYLAVKPDSTNSFIK